MASHYAGYDAGHYQIVFTRCDLDPTVDNWVVSHINHDVDDDPEGPAETDVDATKPISCVDDDVRIRDGRYGVEAPRGFYQCTGGLIDYQGEPACSYGLVSINLSYDGASGIPESDNHTLQVVCHEIGHALGLDHVGYTGSCMIHGDDGANRHFDDHDMYTIDFHHNPSPLD